MMHVDLEQPAELTLWPGHVPARAAEMRSFPTLRAALDAAAEAIDGQDAIPWIITDSGDILASPKIAHPSTTAARTFSVCGVMPLLLPCRLPYHDRFLPPLAVPPPTCHGAVQAETGSGDAAIHLLHHLRSGRRERPRRATRAHMVPVIASQFASGLPRTWGYHTTRTEVTATP